jgi:hypothetical protein
MKVKSIVKNIIIFISTALVSACVAIFSGLYFVLPWLQNIFFGQIGAGSIVSFLSFIAMTVLIFVIVFFIISTVVISLRNKNI